MRPPARHSRNPSRLEVALFELAPKKGYTIEDTVPASTRRYRLMNDFTHRYEPSKSGSAAWSVEAAVKFLREQPDVD
jgi:hypothetical protein